LEEILPEVRIAFEKEIDIELIQILSNIIGFQGEIYK